MFKKLMGKISPARLQRGATLEPQMVKRLVRAVMTTRSDEIGCEECFEQLDRFVEMKLAGKNAAEAMPLVQDHLDLCADCREEFEALVMALKTMA
jgi:hypothetical protein